MHFFFSHASRSHAVTSRKETEQTERSSSSNIDVHYLYIREARAQRATNDADKRYF